MVLERINASSCLRRFDISALPLEHLIGVAATPPASSPIFLSCQSPSARDSDADNLMDVPRVGNIRLQEYVDSAQVFSTCPARDSRATWMQAEFVKTSKFVGLKTIPSSSTLSAGILSHISINGLVQLNPGRVTKNDGTDQPNPSLLLRCFPLEHQA